MLPKGKPPAGVGLSAIPNVLQPGNRSDVLMVFPEPGDYCLIDEQAPPNTTVNQQPKDRRLLATVRAEGQGTVGDDKSHITQALVAAARVAMPQEILTRVIDDLNADLKLTLFAPHKTIEDGEVEDHQFLSFNIDLSSPSPSTPNPRFGVNHIGYDPGRINRVLKLGSVDEWELTSTLANHPFHIHVNPFQVVKILKQVTETDTSGNSTVSWKDLTDPSIDYATRLSWEAGPPGTLPDPQYLDLKGVWKDTLFIKAGYKAYVRTRYERYIGDFVLHCHILDHEEQGMMENIRISLSGEGRHDNH